MGKQSSRIYYKGNDHKDIYCLDEQGNGHYHNSMWLSDNRSLDLVWQKLYGGEIHSGAYDDIVFAHFPDVEGNTIGMVSQVLASGVLANAISVNGDGSICASTNRFPLYTRNGLNWFKNTDSTPMDTLNFGFNGNGVFRLVDLRSGNYALYFDDELLDIEFAPDDADSYTVGGMIANRYFVIVDSWLTLDSSHHVSGTCERYRFIDQHGYIVKQNLVQWSGQRSEYLGINARGSNPYGRYLYSAVSEVGTESSECVMMRYGMTYLSSFSCESSSWLR